jgi:hypothetical protein
MLAHLPSRIAGYLPSGGRVLLSYATSLSRMKRLIDCW